VRPFALNGIGLFREQVGVAQAQPPFVSRLALRLFLCYWSGRVVLAIMDVFLIGRFCRRFVRMKEKEQSRDHYRQS